MKRTICALLAALMLLTALPAQAAGAGTIKVMGSSGAVTVGMRTIDYHSTLIYTTDGVNWRQAETPADFQRAHRGYYTQGSFWLCPGLLDRPSWTSADGVHWTRVETGPSYPRGMADLGPYHFELDETGGLWLYRNDNSNQAAEIPAVREAYVRTAASYGEVQAYYGPNGTVTVEVYDDWDLDGYGKFTASYATSSLDWILENQAQYQPYAIQATATDGKLTLGQRAVLFQTWPNREIVYSYDGLHYARFQSVPWGTQCRLLPYNGKTFLVQDYADGALYASEDGSAWRDLRGTYLCPELPEGVNRGAVGGEYSVTWTGSEYVTCQRISEGRYGMMGSGGGQWYEPVSTKVCFADADFRLTGSYDFGRQVVGVGYYNGTWMAQVQEAPMAGAAAYDYNAPMALYTSRDKEHWEKTDILQLVEALRHF